MVVKTIIICLAILNMFIEIACPNLQNSKDADKNFNRLKKKEFAVTKVQILILNICMVLLLTMLI